MIILSLVFLLFALNGQLEAKKKSPFVKIADWKYLAFDWPYEYDTKSIAPIDVQPYSSGIAEKLFITIHRGPFPLGVVTSRMFYGNPVIEPFPNINWYLDNQTCDGAHIIAVNRIELDKCGNLWVVDSGVNGKQRCQPQLLVFNAETKALLYKVTLGWDLLNPAYDLTNIKIDTRGKSCLRSYAYISNSRSSKIIVVDMFNSKAWTVRHPTLKPDFSHSKFKIGDDRFRLNQGVVGMDLSPYWTLNRKELENSKLFFSTFSGVQLHYVNTSYLINPVGDPSNHFFTFPGNSTSQSAAMAINEEGVAFFGKIRSTSLNCWNTKLPEYGNNIKTVYKNPISLQYLSGVKIYRDVDGVEELWILSSRLQKIFLKNLNTRKINFRIMKAKIEDIKKYANC